MNADLEQALTRLLLESKAANEELYAAFALIVRAEGAPNSGKTRPRVADAEMQRYVEALRRFDAIYAKIQVFSEKLRRSNNPKLGRASPRTPGRPRFDE